MGGSSLIHLGKTSKPWRNWSNFKRIFYELWKKASDKYFTFNYLNIDNYIPIFMYRFWIFTGVRARRGLRHTPTSVFSAQWILAFLGSRARTFGNLLMWQEENLGKMHHESLDSWDPPLHHHSWIEFSIVLVFRPNPHWNHEIFEYWFK